MSRYLVDRIAATPEHRAPDRDRGHGARRRPGAAPRERDLGLPPRPARRETAADPQPLPLRRRRSRDELGAALPAQARPRGLRADRRGGAGRRRRASRRSRRACPASSPSATCARARSSASAAPSARARRWSPRSTPRWRPPTRPDAACPSRSALHGILRLLARPVRRRADGAASCCSPIAATARPARIFVIGRAFWQRTDDSREAEAELRAIVRRIRRRPVRGARIRARFYGAEREVETDRDGYFRVEMAPGEPVPTDRRLAPPRARDAGARARVAAFAEVYIPPPRGADRGRLRHRRHGDAHRRRQQGGDALAALRAGRREPHRLPRRLAALPGAARRRRRRRGQPDALRLARALGHLRASSRSSSSAHEIPVGPILFLREWGISWKHPLPRRAVDHKRALIEAMMALYADMPFVLIGDSGQHDPEVYRRIVERYGARVRAVYIRDVRPAARSGRRRSRRWPRRCARPAAHLVLAADSAGDRRGRGPARADRAGGARGRRGAGRGARDRQGKPALEPRGGRRRRLGCRHQTRSAPPPRRRNST